MDSKRVRVLIVDDHTIVRTGLRALIGGETGMELVGEAVCGSEAVQMARDLSPEVIVLDLSLPDLDGIGVTRLIKSEQPDLRVLILTVHEDEALLREAIRAGASGYILKHAAESELIAAIYSVRKGDLYVHPRLVQALLTNPEKTRTPKEPGFTPEEMLTPREIEVLRLIVQGYTNRQIAEVLTLSVRTVEGHRSNLTDKLGLHSRVELARYARDHGMSSPST